MDISDINRLNIGHLPTPFEFLPNLTQYFSGPKLYIKRDDCTGIAGGGNKVRKLDFLLADALAKNADTVITQGAIQSNHVRQTAALCAKLGLECHVLLEDRTGEGDQEFYANGNVMLDQLFGAEIEMFPGGTDMNERMLSRSHCLIERGKNPYIIPGGGSNSVGGLGYVVAANELLLDAKMQNLTINHIVHATGSAGTQSGLVAGLAHYQQAIPVTGISVRFPQSTQQPKVHALAKDILHVLNPEADIPLEQVRIDDRFIGKGYGIPGEDTIEAIALFAKKEGILLDPVYTGKGAAGLLQLVSEKQFAKNDCVVFIHTGGAQSLPGFRQYFDFPDIQMQNDK